MGLSPIVTSTRHAEVSVNEVVDYTAMMAANLRQPRAILFDVDGVLIRPPHYYSRELAVAGYRQAEECLTSYYAGERHKECLIGLADAMEAIIPHLKAMGWPPSSDVYLRQQFRFERQFLDGAMISIVSSLRRQGLLCCLATDQEKHRARYLLEDMDFKGLFDRHYISCLIGQRKCHQAFWAHVVAELSASRIEPEEAVFVDDIQGNIDAASSAGICGIRFETVEDFKTKLAQMGLRPV